MSNQLQKLTNYLNFIGTIHSTDTIIVLQEEIYSIKNLILRSESQSPQYIEVFLNEKITKYYDELDKQHLITISRTKRYTPVYTNLHNLYNYLIMKRNGILYRECNRAAVEYIIKEILLEN